MEGQYISTHMAAGWSRPREPRTYRSQATPTQVALAPTPTLPGYFERIGYDNRVQQYFKNRLHSMEKNRNPARKRARARACVCICVHCTYRVQIGHRSTKYNRTWHELGTNLGKKGHEDGTNCNEKFCIHNVFVLITQFVVLIQIFSQL